MTRKDSEKDSERPRYYSQFWLDIAAGRRTIGSSKAEEEGEGSETGISEPVPQRKTPRPSEPEVAHVTHLTTEHQEEVALPNSNEALGDPDKNSVDEGYNNNYQDSVPLEDDDIPDMDLSIDEEDENTEESLMDEEEEEEDDDVNWGGGRGRKKTKSARPAKTPLKKPGKTRRSF